MLKFFMELDPVRFQNAMPSSADVAKMEEQLRAFLESRTALLLVMPPGVRVHCAEHAVGSLPTILECQAELPVPSVVFPAA